MNRDQAKALLPIIQAFAEGKEIQFRFDGGNWSPCDKDISFQYNASNYRIKPEPKWRPWEPAECPVYFIVRNKDSARLAVACKQEGYNHVRAWANGYGDNGATVEMYDLFTDFLRVHENGRETPCGVQEVES